MSCVTRCTLVLVVALPSVPLRWAAAGDDPTPLSVTAFCRDLPRSLRADPELRPILLDMCRRAPTFRRQLARIAQEPDLVVTLDVWRTRWSDWVRASTRLHREVGGLRWAEVQVRVDEAHRVVELVAHEFEHILEQLDDIDLNLWVGRGGVYRIGSDDARGAIETARARFIGRRAAAEYGSAPPRQARTGRRP